MKGGQKYSLTRKISVIVFLFVSSIGFLPGRVFGYDTNIAHPNISELAAKLYNAKFDPDLTVEEIGWIKQGSIDEDTPTRWLNHFYDPIYNRGIWFGKQELSAKAWTTDAKAQSNFALGDKTWERGLDDYRQNDREKAFKELGHVVHLISDMTVPAHTRDDIHVLGDYYEQFVKNNWESIKNNLQFKFKQVDNLAIAFDGLAKFSNKNFYSNDTVEASRYQILPIKKYEIVSSTNGNTIKLAKTDSIDGSLYGLYAVIGDFDWKDGTKTVENTVVMQSYYKILIPQAISYSSGVIKLFLDEGQKAGTTKLADNRIGLLGYADRAVGGIIQGLENVYNLLKPAKPGIEVVKADETAAIEVSQSLSIRPELMPKGKSVTSDLVTGESVLGDTVTRVTYPYSDPGIVSSPKPVSVVTPSAPVVQTPVAVSPIVVQPQMITPLPAPAPVLLSTPTFVFFGGGGGASTPTPEHPSTTLGAGLTTQSPDHVEDATTSTTTIENSIEIVTTMVETVTTTIDTVTTTTETTTDIVTTTTDMVTSTEETTTTVDFTATTTVEVVTTTIETPTTTPEEATTTLPIAPVVFNEIGWMGTYSTKSSDEWIELYNNTDTEIDLVDWKIMVSDKVISWNKKQAKIAAHGYYLLERSDDNSVFDMTADGIFTVSGGLNNSGEKLVLLNGNDEVVDEVDCTNGWFAGSTANGRYKSMAKIDSTASGNATSSWQASNSVGIIGRAEGGPYIIGSPRQSNQRYWLLKELTNYYGDQFAVNNTLKLTKAESPYLIDAQTEIPVGYTVEIEPGVIIANGFKGSYFTVKGSLKLNGTADEPIIITSILDTNYITNNPTGLTGTASSGDWGRIEVLEGGKLDVDNVKFYYSGNKFMAPTGWFYNKFMMQTIRNVGGAVSIDNSEFKYNPIDSITADQTYNAIVWTEAGSGKFATTTINNSKFDGGWMGVKNYQGTVNSSFTNNTFENLQSPDGVIVSQYNLPTLENNIFTNNATDWLDLGMLNLKDDVTLYAGIKYLFNTITVPINKTLTIKAGVQITMKKQGDIQVQGKLIAEGEADKPVVIKSKLGEEWGIMAFQNSIGSTLAYTNLSSGNLSTLYTATTRGMITMVSSSILLDNVNLTDSRRPWYMIYAKNSNLDMRNGLISWSYACTTCSGSIVVGVESSGNSTIKLDNTYFNRMTRGIEINSGGTLTLSNMDTTFFQNISDLNWWPKTAWGW